MNLLVNMVRMDSGNDYNLMWCLLALSVPGFDPAILVKLPIWNNDDIFNFALLFILFFGSKLKRVWFKMIAPTALCSSTQLTNLCMPMQLRHYSCVSLTTRPHLMMSTFHPTYASWAWLIKSTLMLVHVHTGLFRAFVELLAWK